MKHVRIKSGKHAMSHFWRHGPADTHAAWSAHSLQPASSCMWWRVAAGGPATATHCSRQGPVAGGSPCWAPADRTCSAQVSMTKTGRQAPHSMSEVGVVSCQSLYFILGMSLQLQCIYSRSVRSSWEPAHVPGFPTFFRFGRCHLGLVAYLAYVCIIGLLQHLQACVAQSQGCAQPKQLWLKYKVQAGC